MRADYSPRGQVATALAQFFTPRQPEALSSGCRLYQKRKKGKRNVFLVSPPRNGLTANLNLLEFSSATHFALDKDRCENGEKCPAVDGFFCMPPRLYGVYADQAELPHPGEPSPTGTPLGLSTAPSHQDRKLSDDSGRPRDKQSLLYGGLSQ